MGFFESHFVEAGFQIAGRRQDHVRQEFVIGKNVFLQNILRGRHREVVRRGDFSLSTASKNAEPGAVGNQRNGKVRRMHDMAWTIVAEYRVVLVFTGGREAAVAAFLETNKFLIPEVPAARPLIDVAAYGAPSFGFVVFRLRRPRQRWRDTFSRRPGVR